MSKKILSILLSMVMVLSIFAILPMSASAITSGDYEYRVLGDGTAEITNYKGGGGEIEIPSILSGHIVTSIGYQAFWSFNSDFYSVTIPNSVTSIGERAFQSSNSLTNIVIPNSVTTIGDYAFHSCGLTEVTIPDSVTSIGECAFGCHLKSITVDSNNINFSSVDGNLYDKYGNTLIRYAAGKNAPSFTIPDSVETIDDYALAWSYNLTNVTIPDSVTTIDDYAFWYCKSLTEVNIPDSVTTIGASAFQLCARMEKLSIGNHVTTIGDEAFFSCSELKKVNIPISVTIIGNLAFGYYYNGDYRKVDGFTIYGYHDTAAEEYANNNGLTFIAQEVILLGDVDGDDDVSSVDATYILRYCAQMNVNISEESLMSGDVDGNGDIEVVDATYIQRWLAEITVPYPIGEPIG